MINQITRKLIVASSLTHKFIWNLPILIQLISKAHAKGTPWQKSLKLFEILMDFSTRKT